MDVLLLREEFPSDRQLQERLRAQASRSVVNADHTCNLYRVDEALSALQKAIRRSNTEDALYWAAELDRSGYHRATMQRLVLIGSEDVGLAQPAAPMAMWEAFQEWEGEKKAGREAGGMARAALLGLAWALAAGPKSRSACLAAGFAVRAVDGAISNGCPALGVADCSACGFGHLRALRAAALRSREDLRYEEEALMHLQILMYEAAQWQWERHIWQLLLDLQPATDMARQNIRALHALDAAIEGVERLRVFHALLLYTRERFLDADHRVPHNSECADPVFLETAYTRKRHPHGIPWYCVDKHTLRGHGTGPGNVVRGRDSTADLRKAAQAWGVDIGDWSAEEVAKSHGPGREWPRHRGIGLPTMISQFMDEGCIVEPEVYPGPSPPSSTRIASVDPMHGAVREFGLSVEEVQGPKVRPSLFVLERLTQWRASPAASHFHPPAPAPASPVDPTAPESAPGPDRKRKTRVQGSWGK